MFPGEDTNFSMDQQVASLSQEMVDDYPASDPRWAESVPQGRGAFTFSAQKGPVRQDSFVKF